MRISIVLLLFLLTGCSGGKTTSSGSDNAQSLRAGSISCTAAYRADVSQPIEREETITFEDVNGEQTIAFADMRYSWTIEASVMSHRLDEKQVFYDPLLYSL